MNKEMNEKALARIKELMKNIYEDYTELDGLLSSVLKNEPEIEKKEPKKKLGDVKETGLFCSVCSKEITPVDVEIRGQQKHFEPENIAWFSQKEFKKNICWSCQNESKSGEGN